LALRFLKNVFLVGEFSRIQKSEILYWLDDGAVAAAGVIWTVVAFIVVHKDAQDRRAARS
jgi:hypothetical protein